MGQTLSEPVTAKETASCGDNCMKVGSSSMQGWRINMEDAHTHILSLPDDKQAAFFAVYDGHGGAKVSQYAGKHLHKTLIQTEAYQQGRIEEALKDAFLQIDCDMLSDDDLKDELSGTTAVCVLMKNNRVYCANVGDSRAIMSVGGLAEPLSHDHKPANEIEARRIVAAGGWVEFNRVNGNLALSRALGDFIFKRNEERTAEEQIVCAVPDVIVRDVTSESEFLLLACDGIWDVLSNQEVADFVRDRLASGMEPEVVCEELLTRCLAPDCQMGGLGCDNMTVVLVCLMQGLSWAEYSQKCARPRPPSPMTTDEPEDDEQPELAGASPFVTPPHTPHRQESDTNAVIVVGGAADSTDEHQDSSVSADNSNTAAAAAPVVNVDVIQTPATQQQQHQQSSAASNNNDNKSAVSDEPVPDDPVPDPEPSTTRRPVADSDPDDDDRPPAEFVAPPPTNTDEHEAKSVGAVEETK